MQAEHQYALKDIMNILPQPPNTEITSVYSHMQLLHLSGQYHQTARDPNTMNARTLKILKMLNPALHEAQTSDPISEHCRDEAAGPMAGTSKESSYTLWSIRTLGIKTDSAVLPPLLKVLLSLQPQHLLVINNFTGK